MASGNKTYPDMEKIMSSFVSVALAVLICFLPTGKTFAHTFQDEDQSDTTIATTEIIGSSSAAYVKGITSMRARSLVGVALSMLSLVIGWRARKRSSAGNSGRNGARIALFLGGIAMVLSVIHLNLTGGAVFGSGSGKAGAILALILSLVGIWFGATVFRQKNSNDSIF